MTWFDWARKQRETKLMHIARYFWLLTLSIKQIRLFIHIGFTEFDLLHFLLFLLLAYFGYPKSFKHLNKFFYVQICSIHKATNFYFFHRLINCLIFISSIDWQEYMLEWDLAYWIVFNVKFLFQIFHAGKQEGVCEFFSPFHIKL